MTLLFHLFENIQLQFWGFFHLKIKSFSRKKLVLDFSCSNGLGCYLHLVFSDVFHGHSLPRYLGRATLKECQSTTLITVDVWPALCDLRGGFPGVFHPGIYKFISDKYMVLSQWRSCWSMLHSTNFFCSLACSYSTTFQIRPLMSCIVNIRVSDGIIRMDMTPRSMYWSNQRTECISLCIEDAQQTCWIFLIHTITCVYNHVWQF